MPSFDSLRGILIKRLYEEARQPSSVGEFSGASIVTLLGDHVGEGVAREVMTSLSINHFLRQTRAIRGNEGGYYAITERLIREAERVASPSDSGTKSELIFTRFRDDLIIALYDKTNEQGFELYNLKQLADEKAIPYREGWVTKVGEFLDEQGYALAAISKGGDESCDIELKANGLEYAEELIEQSNEELSGEESDSIPASDRYVEIGDNIADFKDAESKVIAATEAIRGFNGPTSYEKELVVSELTLGQQLFSSVMVRVGAAVALILTPLYTVYHDTAAEALKPIVGAAIEALRLWLGI